MLFLVFFVRLKVIVVFDDVGFGKVVILSFDMCVCMLNEIEVNLDEIVLEMFMFIM